MKAGRRDRRITLQRKVVTQNETGEEVVSWQDVARPVWAEKIENRGSERFAAQQFIGSTVKTFRILWSVAVSEVTVEHRVLFDGREFDISDVREIGRRVGLEIECFTPSEKPVA